MGSLIPLSARAHTHTHRNTHTYAYAHKLQRLIHYGFNPLNLPFPGKENAYWESLVFMLMCTQNMPEQRETHTDTQTDRVMNYWSDVVINSHSAVRFAPSPPKLTPKISNTHWFHTQCVCVCVLAKILGAHAWLGFAYMSKFVNSNSLATWAGFCLWVPVTLLAVVLIPWRHMHFIHECKWEIDSGSNRWCACARCRICDANRNWNRIRSGVGENYRRLGGGRRWSKRDGAELLHFKATLLGQWKY